ncbi:hypothetical protein K505DRAFT_399602 [Melanomma pulvis-pyrius CBS 109.77]|uniref:DUF7924 domain-containing protein n=1 Tax=Melanomma pulvis-pyrius CBS 109.77 TaxID=1314802 RepID=A0A6A6WQN9_9PLEO|nr:hypothetical protein K505DRAFT_399602 [Melanomma pulvis-pyrius CBS 109.77]
MDKYKPGVTEASERICQTLLDSKQIVPKDTIFGDDIFDETSERLRAKNKARIFKDCTPLIVPWAEAHASPSTNRDLDIAIESVNEEWNNSILIVKAQQASALSGRAFILVLFHGHIPYALSILHVRSEVWFIRT